MTAFDMNQGDVYVMELKINFHERGEPQNEHEQISCARRMLGYTQAYVAECLEMSTRQYVKYEKGEIDVGQMSFQQGINLCELLHIEIYRLITPLEERLGNS